MPVDKSPAYRNRDRLIRYQLHNGFLSDEGSSEAQRYHRNKVSSPLLRLPSELRLRIYHLLLGDRQIHIHFVPWQFKRPLKRSKAGQESVKGHFQYKVMPYKQNPWASDVENLWEAASASQNAAEARLTLLSGVCRQLYHETALLPHMLNTWSFESIHMMERYILKESRMSLQQRRAVEILYCKDRLPRDLRNKFKGLKVIVWKDNDNLRWQELDVFPDVAWKDRRELLERSWRWHSGGRISKHSTASLGTRDRGC
ncbi:unnamed protein product [Discula destructiva]